MKAILSPFHSWAFDLLKQKGDVVQVVEIVYLLHDSIVHITYIAPAMPDTVGKSTARTLGMFDND